MGRFHENSLMGSIFQDPVFEEYSRFLIYDNPQGVIHPMCAMEKMPLSMTKQIGWPSEAILEGVEFLEREIKNEKSKLYFVYDKEECTESQMENVNLYRLMPEKIDPLKEVYVLAAGGSYSNVCTMVEALPTAKAFVDAGHQVFLLSYRVGEECVAPKALRDLARAMRYLCEHQEELQVDFRNLVVGGFSAGANLVSMWGTANIGYKKYQLPKPKALLQIYTVIDLKQKDEGYDLDELRKQMFGDSVGKYIDDYNVADHIGADYPPCYIVCGKNDTTVPPRNSELLKDLLDHASVPAVLEEGENAPHGFGNGSGTDVNGWPIRAMEFIKTL